MSPPSSGDEYPLQVYQTQKTGSLNNYKQPNVTVGISMLNDIISELRRPTMLHAAEISPYLILPYGTNKEVSDLRKKINRLPKELLIDEELVLECRAASNTIEENLNFWQGFFKDDRGLKWFELKKKKSLKRRMDEVLTPLEQFEQFQLQQKKARLDPVSNNPNDQGIVPMQTGM